MPLDIFYFIVLFCVQNPETGYKCGNDDKNDSGVVHLVCKNRQAGGQAVENKSDYGPHKHDDICNKA